MVTMLIAMLLLAPNPSVAGSARLAHVRPASRIARAILDEAQRRSATVQALVQELQRLETIVYVELAYDQYGDHGTTSIMSGAGPVRILRVVVNARLDPARRIEVLGHELEHAIEIAREPDVRDGPTFRALFERIGYAVSDTSFETDGAREVEQLVRADLSRRPGDPIRPPEL